MSDCQIINGVEKVTSRVQMDWAQKIRITNLRQRHKTIFENLIKHLKSTSQLNMT